MEPVALASGVGVGLVPVVAPLPVVSAVVLLVLAAESAAGVVLVSAALSFWQAAAAKLNAAMAPRVVKRMLSLPINRAQMRDLRWREANNGPFRLVSPGQ